MLRVKVFNHLVSIPQIKLLLRKEDVFLGGTEPLQNGGVNSIIEIDSGTEEDFRELVTQLSGPTRGIFVEKIPNKKKVAGG